MNLGVHRARLLLSRIWMDIMASMESMNTWTLGIPSQSKKSRKDGMQACMHVCMSKYKARALSPWAQGLNPRTLEAKVKPRAPKRIVHFSLSLELTFSKG